MNEETIRILKYALKSHSDDCLFCAVKDTAINKVLSVVSKETSEMRDRLWKDFLLSRGVIDPCPSCGGLGRKVYANTSTWMGGIGGQVLTGDVCDVCWGTGDKDKKGTDLRKLYNQIEQISFENQKLKEVIEG